MVTETIEIKLPLSATTFSGLGRGICAVWPDAVIQTDQIGYGYARIQVDGPGTPVVKLADIEVDDDGWKPPPGMDVEVFLATIHNGEFGVKLPEWFSRVMLAGARAALDEAENYVEMLLVDPTTHERFTVTVLKPGGRTPHELRLEAEAERDEALAQLTALTDQL